MFAKFYVFGGDWSKDFGMSLVFIFFVSRQLVKLLVSNLFRVQFVRRLVCLGLVREPDYNRSARYLNKKPGSFSVQ